VRKPGSAKSILNVTCEEDLPFNCIMEDKEDKERVEEATDEEEETSSDEEMEEEEVVDHGDGREEVEEQFEQPSMLGPFIKRFVLCTAILALVKLAYPSFLVLIGKLLPMIRLMRINSCRRLSCRRRTP